MDEECLSKQVSLLMESQLSQWPTARDNYAALKTVRLRQFEVEGLTFRVQYNPARIRSTAARVDKQSIGQRPCFLCAANRPAEQAAVSFLRRYDILVNPYPIFPRHLTIADRSHSPQRLAPRMADMLALARELPEFTVFYNGPACGASAPDHAHFQAGSRGVMPIEREWQPRRGKPIRIGSSRLYLIDDSPRHSLVVVGTRAEELSDIVARLLDLLHKDEGEAEPKVNVLALYEEGLYIVIVLPRRRHRPSCYFAEGREHLLVSPASVDLGGLIIVPTEEDFLKIDARRIREIVSEVCADRLSANDVQRLIRSTT